MSWTHVMTPAQSGLTHFLEEVRAGEARRNPERGPPVSPREMLHTPEGPVDTVDSPGQVTDASSEYPPPIVSSSDPPFRTPPDLWCQAGLVTSPLTPPPSPRTPAFSPLPYSLLSSAEVERMIKRSKTDQGRQHTPDLSPLPYTPLTGAEVQRMTARPKPKGGAAKWLFS